MADQAIGTGTRERHDQRVRGEGDDDRCDTRGRAHRRRPRGPRGRRPYTPSCPPAVDTSVVDGPGSCLPCSCVNVTVTSGALLTLGTIGVALAAWICERDFDGDVALRPAPLYISGAAFGSELVDDVAHGRGIRDRRRSGARLGSADGYADRRGLPNVSVPVAPRTADGEEVQLSPSWTNATGLEMCRPDRRPVTVSSISAAVCRASITSAGAISPPTSRWRCAAADLSGPTEPRSTGQGLTLGWPRT